MAEPIEVFKPGVQYYADRIRSGVPFSFVRYADGCLRVVIPGLMLCERLRYASCRLEIEELRETFLHAWRDENYVVGLLDVHLFKKWPADYVLGWIRANMPDLDWHASGVWTTALTSGTLYPVVQAIREQPLPLILVGPECIAGIGKLAQWEVRQHIVTNFANAWPDRHAILRQIGDVREPAFFMLSTGPVTKFIIYRAWPWIGYQSFMIDFGSVWNAFTHPCRKFHRKLSREILDKCLGIQSIDSKGNDPA
jgi:hypothetical protein